MRSTTELLRKTLTGWGRTAPTVAMVAKPMDRDELEYLLGSPPGIRIVARGMGRSYGDAAQSGGGVVIDTSALNAIGPVDPEAGTVVVGGGASIDQLIRRSVPLGWFVAVTPGTSSVSIGGAIAADVHGKNHHRDGGFGRYVREMTLATPTGTYVIGPERDPELFWATCGGMGLTGVILEATLQLIPVETAWVTVDTERLESLHALMSAMESTDHQYRYSVAWLDCLGHRNGSRRSVLTRGDHAPASALPAKLRGQRPALPPGTRFRVPVTAPRRLANQATVRALNEAWFRTSPPGRSAVRRLSSFFYPLDRIGDWNRLYGPGGFVQYQFAVATQRGDVVEQAVGAIADSGIPSFLAVLKRFGAGNPGPLSFPMEGWTLALDFPVGPPRLPTLLNGLDELVAEAGGRVYLAKDSRLRPELLPVMYPRLKEMAAVCRRVDPKGVIGSDLSRRLGISLASS